jgi:hypothetical protein
MDKMTALYIEEAQKSIYTGESAVNCEEYGEPTPEKRRKAIACKYCLLSAPLFFAKAKMGSIRF